MDENSRPFCFNFINRLFNLIIFEKMIKLNLTGDLIDANIIIDKIS